MSDRPPVPFLLPAELDLAAADSLCRALNAALAEGGITAEGAQVERVSTPCLQVLAAAATTARMRRQPFRLTNPSDVLRSAIADLGLHQVLSFED